MAIPKCIQVTTRTFEGILSIDVGGGAIQALDGANHDRRRRLGRAEADNNGQEHNKGTAKRSSSRRRNQPSPHDGETPTSASAEELI